MPYDDFGTILHPTIRFRAAALDLVERARAGRLDEAELRAALHRLALRCRTPARELWDHYTGGRYSRP